MTSIYNQESAYIASWSPCNRYIAVARSEAVEIRDAVTLSLLNTFKSPPNPRLSQVRFSPDSRCLTRFNRADLITWDLQTGGPVGVGAILPEGLETDNRNPSSTYSPDGKMLAAVYLQYSDGNPKNPNTFIATHDSSTTHAHLYRIPEGRLIPPIWTHGEFLRFATLEPGYITIWEAEFTLTQTPKVVESLPTPDKIADGKLWETLFLPTLSRLAMVFNRELLVWDARDSKLLLKTPTLDPNGMSFSSDGRFFACRDDHDVRVWKESPTGYVLHQDLEFSPDSGPFLSPNGESIIASFHSTIHLWHTKNTNLSGDPFLDSKKKPPFRLEFSPHHASAAFWRNGETRVTILDLQSGDPQLEIDVVKEVGCLGITESSVAVVSRNGVSAWDLATGAATVGIRDRAPFVQPYPSPSGPFRSLNFISVSPDLSRVATTGRNLLSRIVSLEIHDTFTGRWLASAVLDTGVLKLL